MLFLSISTTISSYKLFLLAGKMIQMFSGQCRVVSLSTIIQTSTCLGAKSLHSISSNVNFNNCFQQILSCLASCWVYIEITYSFSWVHIETLFTKTFSFQSCSIKSSNWSTMFLLTDMLSIHDILSSMFNWLQYQDRMHSVDLHSEFLFDCKSSQLQ